MANPCPVPKTAPCVLTVRYLKGQLYPGVARFSGGLRGFARHYAAQFNAAAEGSQMRTSMLLAGIRLITQYAEELDVTPVKPEDMTDEELAAYPSGDL